MKLSTKVVIELSKIKGEIAALKEKEEKLVAKVKKEMKRKELEEYAPEDSPYMFVYSRFDRSTVSWKKQWEKLAKKLYGKSWKKRQTTLVENSEKETDTLNVEINPNYNGKRS